MFFFWHHCRILIKNIEKVFWNPSFQKKALPTPPETGKQSKNRFEVAHGPLISNISDRKLQTLFIFSSDFVSRQQKGLSVLTNWKCAQLLFRFCGLFLHFVTHNSWFSGGFGSDPGLSCAKKTFLLNKNSVNPTRVLLHCFTVAHNPEVLETPRRASGF